MLTARAVSPRTVTIEIPACDNDRTSDAIAAALAKTTHLSLLPSPFTTTEFEDFYGAVAALEKELEGDHVRRGELALEAWDAVWNALRIRCDSPRRLQPVKASVNVPDDAPSDVATERCMPAIDAAYFFGVAIGLRLSKALQQFSPEAR